MTKKKLFTEAEAAKELTVSAVTLYRWRKERRIRHYRQLGRLIRYTPEDIQQNLEDMKAYQPKPIVQRSVSEARFG
jgi:excisionase family DNA binding protein